MMDTMRIKAIQAPSQIEEMLDAFVAAVDYLPSSARPILERSDLPSALQRHARRAADNESWRAWADERRIWFIVGKVSPFVSRQVQQPALHVFFYDTAGRLSGSGVWTCEENGRWIAHEVTGSTTVTRLLAPDSVRTLKDPAV